MERRRIEGAGSRGGGGVEGEVGGWGGVERVAGDGDRGVLRHVRESEEIHKGAQ